MRNTRACCEQPGWIFTKNTQKPEVWRVKFCPENFKMKCYPTSARSLIHQEVIYSNSSTVALWISKRSLLCLSLVFPFPDVNTLPSCVISLVMQIQRNPDTLAWSNKPQLRSFVTCMLGACIGSPCLTLHLTIFILGEEPLWHSR